MEVRFWGVRGSIAVSGEQYLGTGGNTSCVEITHEGHRLILDGGTGLRGLGQALGYGPVQATILFSHVHWDHIQGVPFFTPAYCPDAKLTIAGAARDSGNIRDALARQMTPPTFPVTLDVMGAQMNFQTLQHGKPWEDGPFRITPIDMNHPDGVFAYRVEAGGRSLVYATDVEHGASGLDKGLLKMSEGVDLLIHDAQYTEPEYRGEVGGSKVGWGHSTWNEAVEVACAANAKQVALFHHDPNRIDTAVDAIEGAARWRHRGAFAAREGMPVRL